MGNNENDNLFEAPIGEEDKKDSVEARLTRIEEGIDKILSFFDTSEEE